MLTTQTQRKSQIIGFRAFLWTCVRVKLLYPSSIWQSYKASVNETTILWYVHSVFSTIPSGICKIYLNLNQLSHVRNCDETSNEAEMEGSGEWSQTLKYPRSIRHCSDRLWLLRIVTRRCQTPVVSLFQYILLLSLSSLHSCLSLCQPTMKVIRQNPVVTTRISLFISYVFTVTFLAYLILESQHYRFYLFHYIDTKPGSMSLW